MRSPDPNPLGFVAIRARAKATRKASLPKRAGSIGLEERTVQVPSRPQSAQAIGNVTDYRRVQVSQSPEITQRYQAEDREEEDTNDSDTAINSIHESSSREAQIELYSMHTNSDQQELRSSPAPFSDISRHQASPETTLGLEVDSIATKHTNVIETPVLCHRRISSAPTSPLLTYSQTRGNESSPFVETSQVFPTTSCPPPRSLFPLARHIVSPQQLVSAPGMSQSNIPSDATFLASGNMASSLSDQPAESPSEGETASCLPSTISTVLQQSARLSTRTAYHREHLFPTIRKVHTLLFGAFSPTQDDSHLVHNLQLDLQYRQSKQDELNKTLSRLDGEILAQKESIFKRQEDLQKKWHDYEGVPRTFGTS